MAHKITVALDDDLDAGPAEETVRFGIGGTEYEIDLSNKNAAAFRPRSRLSPATPARPPGDSAAGPVVPQRAGSAAAISVPGRKTTASLSATATASPRASLSSTKPPQREPDTSSYADGPTSPAPILAAAHMIRPPGHVGRS